MAWPSYSQQSRHFERRRRELLTDAIRRPGAVAPATAELTKAALRQTDFLGWYGGEEFCLVFTNTELMDAVLCCERIRQRIEKFASDRG